jgi:hypothetical protein
MNIEPRILENVLNKEDIDSLYYLLDNSTESQRHISKGWGQKSWTLDISKGIIDKIEKIIKEIYGDDWYLEVPRVARYDNSLDCIPYLDPHIDNFLDHRLTLDIQLRSNIDWPIMIDGVSFDIKDNCGLIFSGTKNVHWRPERTFEDGDFVDLLFCHFRSKNNKYEISREENRQRLLSLFKDRERYGYPVDPVSDESFENQLEKFEIQDKNDPERMV